jgi:fumarate hydratase subunit alpha
VPSRTVSFETIRTKVKEACIEANYNLGEDVLQGFLRAKEEEDSPIGKEILDQLIENARIAREERIPLCQDTGLAVFFVELGDSVAIEGGSLSGAINEGVKDGYLEGYLRKSACDPFTRKNTGDNTPAIIRDFASIGM